MVALMTPELLHGPTQSAAHWEFDPTRTEVTFAVGLSGFTTVRGRFRRVRGSLREDRLDLQIEAASIDTGNQMRDRHLRGRDVLDVKRYPRIAFTSKAIVPVDDATYRVTGELAIRGRARPLTLSVLCGDPAGARRTFVAESGLQRKDFGVGPSALNFGFLIGNSVQIRVQGEIVMTEGVE